MKTIVITGATSGFGNGLVKALLEKGHRVVATGRNLSQRSDLFDRERSKFPGQLIEIDLDVIISQQRANVVAQIEKLGRIDVLINNAGYGLFGPLENTDEDKIRDQFEVNFFGPVFLIRDLLPLLRKSRGLIINVSSVLGFVGFPLASLYCACKFAIEGLSESLAYELEPHGVRVALIQPGGYKTNFNSGTKWSVEDQNCHPTYLSQLQNYKKLRYKQSQSPCYQNPQEVIQRMLELVEFNDKTFRSTLGRDARIVRWIRSIIPQQIFHQLAHFIFRNSISKPVEE